MTGIEDNHPTEAQAAEDEAQRPPPWLRASVADVEAVDVNALLAGCADADSRLIGDAFQKAASEIEADPATRDQPTGRVFCMVAAAMQMHFKPHDRYEPFGPLFVMDGRRSAIPSDFRPQIDALSAAAARATHPVLKARLADLCWLLDRKRAPLGFAAITAYVEIVTRMDRGELTHRMLEQHGALHHVSCDLLQRALWIGQSLGRDKPETDATREAVRRLRKQSLSDGSQVEVQRFAALDLDFGVSDPAEVAADIERVLTRVDAEGDRHSDVDLWRLAARGYAYARSDSERDRCLVEASNVLAAHADAVGGSAMLASHFLAQAIAQLGRIPGQRDRRKELRHRLVDVQANVIEEMGSFGQEMNLTEIAEHAQARLGDHALFDQLFIFAFLSNIPKPGDLREQAMASIREHPLSSLFATSHMDREGKVIHRSPGGLLGDDGQEDTIRAKIAQSEGLRRSIVAEGTIAAARAYMNAQHMVDGGLLKLLLQHSPFVPDDLVRTFSTGFAKFFQGDFISAVYILTPLLENSLRHVLKSHSHDVTIFDDATQTQQDRTISQLYAQMRPELDAIFGVSLTADIERVFLEKPGPHLRHAVAHGLLSDDDPFGADAVYGCWLIWRLCLLPLVPHRDQLRLWLAGSDLLGASEADAQTRDEQATVV
jgi:hypothetical protein